MGDILLQYHNVLPATWGYLSSLLTIALFFKFSRLWSVRNLDLIGLILLAPGLLLVNYGQFGAGAPQPIYEQTGYVWLFTVGGLFLVRMLVDPMMVRRPLLEPNLSAGGMTFLGLSLLVFLIGNILTTRPPTAQLAASTATISATAEPAGATREKQADEEGERAQSPLERYGPGYPHVFWMAQLPTRWLFTAEGGRQPAVAEADGDLQSNMVKLYTAHAVAIVSHLAIVLGMIVIGYWHFDNIKTGIAAATLYLLLPYSEFFRDKAYHILLAALLVWAIAMYRRPLVSGIILGLAIGSFYYPVFLLPLWCAFYWQRGLLRFSLGVVSMVVLLAVILYFKPSSGSFIDDLRQMFGWIFPRTEKLQGFWGLPFNDPVYRIPVLAAFVAMCFTLAIWPAQKNLGTLMSCSAAVMIGTQFWHAMEGGQLLGWYLPLALLTIFRPNLEDRVALSVLGEWSFTRRKPRLARIEQAA